MLFRALSAVLCGVASAFGLFAEETQPRIIAYYPEWGIYDRKFEVPAIPADKLTHLIYAFAKIDKGEVSLFDAYAAVDKFHPGDKWNKGYLRGNFRRLQLLKEKHKHLKTLIAIGGWTLSGPFSDVALTEGSREKFAGSAVAFMTKYGFDGIDLDWEYPVGGGLETNKTRKEDKGNYTLLLTTLRKQLDEQGKKDKKAYLLTIAAPAGPANCANIELEKVAKQIDWFNLMSYDFHGSWSARTHFNAPLYPITDDPSDEKTRKELNVDAAVCAYLAGGVPATKICLGVPFIGRGWQGVKNENNGLFQKHGPGLPKGTWEAGVFDYKDLATNYVGKFALHRHKEARAPWLFDAKRGIMISFDDPESIEAKATYAREKKLGGVMVWEITADDAKSSLLKAVQKGLRIGK